MAMPSDGGGSGADERVIFTRAGAVEPVRCLPGGSAGGG